MKSQPGICLPEIIREDTGRYKRQVKRFVKGELEPEKFMGYRVPMGIYRQRGDDVEDKYTIRVRIPGGVISGEQLALLGEISREYGNNYLHITNRQDIQLHYVDIEETPDILDRLLEAGLSSRGGGGNTVRNIINPPRAGVNPSEPFATTPHALALSKYFLKRRSSFKPPGKYDIAFSSTPRDEGLATVNDLGFIAKKKGKMKGFKVYAGGGMGKDPRTGLQIEDFIVEDRIFHIAEAIKRFFVNFGARKREHKGGIRFIRGNLGDKEFVRIYSLYLEEVLKEGIKTEEIHYYEPERNKIDLDSGIVPEANYIYREKYAGYYSLEVSPVTGQIDNRNLQALINLMSEEEMSVRTTHRQGLMFRGIRGDRVEKIIADIAEIDKKLIDRDDNKGFLPAGRGPVKYGPGVLDMVEFDPKTDREDFNRAPEDDNDCKLKDLRGVKCPLNFVKAKLFIEPLEPGEIVKYYLDEGQPIKNVPRSLTAEGHEILEKDRTGEGYYILKVRKGD